MRYTKKLISMVLVLAMLMSVMTGFTVFAWTFDEFPLPDTIGVKGETVTINDVQDCVADDKVFGLYYASEYYDGYLQKAPEITFVGPNFSKTVTLENSPLFIAGNNKYYIKFDVPESLEGGNYKVKIKLYTAYEKGINPFEFTIKNFVVEDNDKDCYEVHIKQLCADLGKQYVLEKFEEYVSDERKEHLIYVSDYYDGSFAESAKFEYYLSDGRAYAVPLDSSPLKFSDDGTYKLIIPTAAIDYSHKRAVIYLPVAMEKGTEDVKPYKIIIDNLVSIDMDGEFSKNFAECFTPDLYALPGEPCIMTDLEEYVPSQLLGAFEAACKDFPVNKGYGTTYFFKQDNQVVFTSSERDISALYKGDSGYELYIPSMGLVSPGKYTLRIRIMYPDGDVMKRLEFVCWNYTILGEEPHTCVWDEGTVTEQPGCESWGEKTYWCTEGCGTKKVDLLSPTGHNYSEEWIVETEATCEENGVKHRVCANCGDKKDETIIEKTGHSFGDWTVTSEPTATTPGVETRKCNNCSEEETRDIEVTEYKNTIFNISDTVSLEKISGAEVFVTSEDGEFTAKGISDSLGKADFDLEDGTYSVQVLKSGYQLRNFAIEKHSDSSVFDIYLNKNDVIKVTTQVKEMSRKEIIDAGIDINAPENQHVYECITVLKFSPVVTGGTFNPTPVNIDLKYYYNEEGSVINARPVYVGGGTIIYPVSKDIYLIVYSKTTWLKEMFDVHLIAANTSSVETIEDCVAEIDLPEGISFAVMLDGEQSETISLGNIAPASSAEHHWYLCGDKAGEYYLDGVVRGTRVAGVVKEKTETRFTTQEPICVLAGDAMHLLIEAERYAVVGTPYRLRYTLRNVSGKTLNNVNLTIPGGKFCKVYDVKNVIHTIETGDLSDLTGTFNDGYTLSDDTFEPGEVLSGVFEITFGTGVDTDYILYMVTDMFTVTGNNSTTEIPTDIVLVDNIEKHRWNDGAIVKEATCTEEGEKIYKCVHDGCSETKTVVLPIKDHKLEPWKVIKEATCTENGEKIRVCENCNYKITAEIPEIAHSFDEGKVKTEPTQNTTGVIEYKCIDCGEIKTEELALNGKDDRGWTLYDNGLLVIDGNDAAASALWEEYASQIRVIRFGNEVTKIGDNLFADAVNLAEVYIPESVTSVSDTAFSACPNLKRVHYSGNREQLCKIMTLGETTGITDEMITYDKPSLVIGDGVIDIYAPDKDCVMIVAVYNGNRLLSMKRIAVKASMKKPVEELGLSYENANILRAFLWEDLINIKPLCNKQEILLDK